MNGEEYGGKMERSYAFEAVIQKVDGIDGAYVEIPFDVKAEFGRGRGRIWERARTRPRHF